MGSKDLVEFGTGVREAPLTSSTRETGLKRSSKGVAEGFHVGGLAADQTTVRLNHRAGIMLVDVIPAEVLGPGSWSLMQRTDGKA